MTMKKSIFTWSGGKDSAMALYDLKKAGIYDTVSLLTTVTEDYDRISMHGVRNILLQKQALSLDIPLEKVCLTSKSSEEDYNTKMKNILIPYRDRGVLSVIFGDIFLEDLRKYREDTLATIGMIGVFPLWKRNTWDLAREFISAGFKAVITCVDSKQFDGKFVSRNFDEGFLSELPDGVDPCGENGEFHSFVYDGPIFREPIEFKKGEVVLRDNRFYFCDLVPT